ncbi:MAG: thermonuclease family protein [Candidatus Altiarchaeota archaeon]
MKNDYKLGIIILLLVVVVIIGVIIIFDIKSQKVVCNRPYILVGTSCCLDINVNSICDKDETASIQQTTMVQGVILNRSTAIVSKVIDGDSIKLQNGIEIRLLGINTPEQGQPYYQEVTNRLRELVEGKTVSLEGDIQDRDQYNRLLRYVFVNDLFVNLQLVKEGYANVLIIQPNTKYEADLKNAQNEVKTSKLNIWKPSSTGEGICDNRCIGISYFHWNAEGNDCSNLNDEYVTFINTCQYPCDLMSWTIKDDANHIYTFPSFILENSRTVTIYTGFGTNTKKELYWSSSGKSCNSIWNNDEDTLYLRNLKGELVLDYSYNMSK